MTDMPFDPADLTGMTDTSFRSCIVAFGLAISGRDVTLSEVARQVGVSRQALHKNHQGAVRFVAWLRDEWKPPAANSSDITRLETALAAANTKVRKEAEKRQRAETERDRALHHLELAVATIEAGSVNSLPRRLPKSVS